MNKHYDNKHHRALKRLKERTINQQNVQQVNPDVAIVDLVLRCLYDNPEKNAMSLDEEIFKPHGITLHRKASEHVWDVLMTSGLISPLIGFGHAGKVELTKTGIQLMTQYGSYSRYLQAGEEAAAPYVVQIAPNSQGQK